MSEKRKVRWTAAELAEPTFLVDRLIPDTGLVILAGPKASGKTQALLSIAAGVSAGGYALGRLRCEQASVLYIQLELSERKVHQRMHRMGLTDVDNIHFPHADRETRIPTWRIGGEGVRDIRLAIERNGYRLVIVDVFQKIWPEHLDLNSYADAYKVLGALREISNETETAIVLATHFRKQESDDISDRIMGSVGIVGNADVVLTIQRQRGTPEGVLSGFGNDIADVNLSMKFDPVTTAWTITDAPPEETLQPSVERPGGRRRHEQAGNVEQTSGSEQGRVGSQPELWNLGRERFSPNRPYPP